MVTKMLLRRAFIGLAILIVALPAPLNAQDAEAPAGKFSQAELDQMLAPVALYPDALLAQVLMAATYPLEVVMADRWVRENGNLRGDALNDALDKQPWDPSVKALVPFPDVLSMMSRNLDWTQRLGDAFLSQETDVMSTVQNLRARASAQGNLQSNDKQTVSRSDDVIVIEPADVQVIYVPAYDPLWVYGPWWWPAFPPFIIYPYPGFVVAPGFIWFGVGFVVGAHWCTAWGHWDWHHHAVFVNANRTININRARAGGTGIRTEPWRHSPYHRRGVIYRDQFTRERFGQPNGRSIEGRRVYRGFPEGRGGFAGARPGEPQRIEPAPHAAPLQTPPRSVEGGRRPETPWGSYAPEGQGRPGTPWGSYRPEGPQEAHGRAFTAPPSGVAGQDHIFEGMHEGGGDIQRQSNWGRESLAPHGTGSRGGGGYRGGHR